MDPYQKAGLFESRGSPPLNMGARPRNRLGRTPGSRTLVPNISGDIYGHCLLNPNPQMVLGHAEGQRAPRRRSGMASAIIKARNFMRDMKVGDLVFLIIQ